MRNRSLVFLTDLPLRWEHAPVSRLLYLARLVYQWGGEVTVVGPDGAAAIEQEPFTVKALPVEATGKMQAIFPFRSAVRKELAACDGVVVRGYWIGFFTLLSAWARRKSLRVLDFHGSTWREVKSSPVYRVLSWLMESLSFHLATHILAVSEGTAAQLPDHAKKKALVLGNGVDLEAIESAEDRPLTWLPDSKDGPTQKTLGIVARFGAHLELNTIHQALDAMQTPVRLVLVGEGPALFAEQFAGDERVLLVGHRPQAEVRAFLRHHCDLALAPYNPDFEAARTEGFYSSRKIREYLAAGIPVLVPDLPGLDALHIDGENCLLYQSGSAAHLAQQIDRIWQEPDLQETLERGGREAIQDFRWDRLAESSGFRTLIEGWMKS